jgi:acyl carrier protein
MALTDQVSAVFEKVFGIDGESFSLDMVPEDVPRWDSLGHMSLVTELENTFNVHFEVDEITELSSGRKALEILKAKGVPD